MKSLLTDRVGENTAETAAGSLPTSGGSMAAPPHVSSITTAAEEPDRFLETVYRNGTFSKLTMSRSSVVAIDGSEVDVDCQINEITGRINIQPQTGPPLQYRGRIPRVGPKVGRPLLEELMWRPGELVSVDDLLRNPQLGSLTCPAVRATRLKTMRRAFGETVAEPWFFELELAPWRLRWCPARSWRIVERLAGPSVPPARVETARHRVRVRDKISVAT